MTVLVGDLGYMIDRFAVAGVVLEGFWMGDGGCVGDDLCPMPGIGRAWR